MLEKKGYHPDTPLYPAYRGAESAGGDLNRRPSSSAALLLPSFCVLVPGSQAEQIDGNLLDLWDDFLDSKVVFGDQPLC